MYVWDPVRRLVSPDHRVCQRQQGEKLKSRLLLGRGKPWYLAKGSRVAQLPGCDCAGLGG